MIVSPLKLSAVMLSVLLVAGLARADLPGDLATVQSAWAVGNYQLAGKARVTALEALSAQGDALVKRYPAAAEAHIWNGIVKSTLAGAKGGLGALGLAKAARAELEQALRLDDQALAGSAYTSLGTLYHKVPGWPVGFGDEARAEKLLRKALQINPEGIDPNYFYAEYLIDQGREDEARGYLLKARKAPPRPGRELADQGRRAEIAVALRRLESH